MRRRWIIRTLFLLPILLCLAGWAWSGTHYSSVSYSHYSHFVECISSGGCVTVDLETAGGLVNGWVWNSFPTAPACFWGPDNPIFLTLPVFHNFLGFGFRHATEGDAYQYTVAVPYWFLLLLSSALYLLIHRKTRPNPHPQTAFPVEITKTDQNTEDTRTTGQGDTVRG